MNVFKNPLDYLKVWNKRKKQIKNMGKKTAFQAAVFMKNESRLLAPHKSGDLKRGISYRKVNQGYIVDSTVPKAFPYNLYVNGDIVMMKYKRPHPMYGIAKGDVISYGLLDPSSNRPGAAKWHWTGKRMYWDTSINKTRKMFTNLAIKNTRVAMRAKI